MTMNKHIILKNFVQKKVYKNTLDVIKTLKHF